jgi:hypothetical protein
MDLRTLLRRILGVIAALVGCYCGLLILNVWFLLPKWPGDSVDHDLLIRVAMTAGCIAVGTGCVFLSQWCFSSRGSNGRPQ